jgi:hypothetical protein
VTGFSAAVRTTIRQRADNYCEICGRKPGVEVHHRRSRNMGSTKRPETNEPANGLLTCREDHRLIEANPTLAEVMGWVVPQHADPASEMVIYRGRAVLLDNLGNLREVA